MLVYMLTLFWTPAPKRREEVKHEQGELFEILILFVPYFMFFKASMQMKTTFEQNTKHVVLS